MRYEKFRESRHAAVKLEIALEEFFLEETPEKARKDYGDYLRLRIRPAVEELIAREDVEHLQALEDLGWIPHSQLDGFLGTAARLRKNAALVWLLGLKQATLGFPGEDFSL